MFQVRHFVRLPGGRNIRSQAWDLSFGRNLLSGMRRGGAAGSIRFGGRLTCALGGFLEPIFVCLQHFDLAKGRGRLSEQRGGHIADISVEECDEIGIAYRLDSIWVREQPRHGKTAVEYLIGKVFMKGINNLEPKPVGTVG